MNQTIFTGPCPGNSPSPPPAGGWCDSGRLQSSNSFVAKWKRCRFRQALEIFWIVLTYLEIILNYLEISWIILKYLELSWTYLDLSWSILKYLEIDDWVMQDYTRRYQTLQDVTRRYSLNHKPWGILWPGIQRLVVGLGTWVGWVGPVPSNGMMIPGDAQFLCGSSIKQPIKRIYISVRDYEFNHIIIYIYIHIFRDYRLV